MVSEVTLIQYSKMDIEREREGEREREREREALNQPMATKIFFFFFRHFCLNRVGYLQGQIFQPGPSHAFIGSKELPLTTLEKKKKAIPNGHYCWGAQYKNTSVLCLAWARERQALHIKLSTFYPWLYLSHSCWIPNPTLVGISKVTLDKSLGLAQYK